MQLFITDEEFESLRSDDDNVTFIVSKVDSFITNLQQQLETVKAQSEASSITAEQTCSLLKQKCISVSSDFENLESQNAELNATIERNLEELGVVKSEMHRIHLESIEKDRAIERLSAEASEIHKSKRQLLGMIEQKDTEIMAKNTTIKSYLDKIDILKEKLASEISLLAKLKDEAERKFNEVNEQVEACLDVDPSIPRCQVAGCLKDLTTEKDTYKKRKICTMHANASFVSIKHRYCQRCFKFHVLSEFVGMNKSCRRSLDMYNKRRKKL